MLLKEELRDAPSNMNMMMMNQHPNMNDIPSFMNIHRQHEITKAPPVNRRKILISFSFLLGFFFKLLCIFIIW